MAFLVSAVNLGKQPPTREWNCPYDLLKFISMVGHWLVASNLFHGSSLKT